MDAAQVQGKLGLSADEDFILTAWQYRMMQRDVAASKGKYLSSKRKARNAFRSAATEAIAHRTQNDWSPVVARTAQEFFAVGKHPNLETLEDAGPFVSSAVSRRSRALLLLIDLYGFEPWIEGKWDKNVRADSLAEAHRALDQLHPEDLDAVETAYKDALKSLSKAGSWKKVALLAGAGLGLGVLTSGLAAPVIAGAFGTLAFGYTGAVATSAGMAALGGGSIAAGGFGMAGGAALIASVGGVVGAGAATLGGKTAGFTAARVAADAIRLHVATQLVLRDVEGNEEAAKAVIVSLRERVANLGGTVVALADRIESLRTQLETKKIQIDAERTRRMEAEARADRFRAALGRLRDRVAHPDDEGLRPLLDELEELEGEKKIVSALAEGVTALATDLEAAA